MRLTNTLTGRVEELVPVEAGRVGIYVCGVTPYDQAHVGHAMSLIVYDVLVRYLRWRDLDVTYVSNYTDVDDRLIERGHAQERDPLELANANIEQWEQEQRALGLIDPDVRPRVSREIPHIVAMIEEIVANDFAYPTPEGNVYFRVRAKDDYGKLSHRNIEALLKGTRFEPGEDKEFPLDFALWKAEKPGEPSWPSPWGPGRPGWHIECSAMSRRYLGERFDIHGGGTDLIFPHHENEIAQAEAAAGARRPVFAGLWVHNGMVQLNGQKMSKSLGNTVNMDAALERWSPDAIRLFVLNSQYRSPNNLTDEAMSAAMAGVDRLVTALSSPSPLAGEGRGGGLPSEDFRQRFIDAMDDDLGTPQALATLFDLARAINRARDAGEPVADAQATLAELAGVLGLTLRDPAEATATLLDAAALARLAASLDVACSGKDAPATLDALIARRTDARKARDFALGDRIRDGLAALGVLLEDSAEGTRWTIKR